MFFDGTRCPEHGAELLGGRFYVNNPPWIQSLWCPVDGCAALEGPNCKNCAGVWIYTQLLHEPGREHPLFKREWPDFFSCVRCGSEIDALYPHDYNHLKSPPARRRAQEIWDAIPAHMKRTAAEC